MADNEENLMMGTLAKKQLGAGEDTTASIPTGFAATSGPAQEAIRKLQQSRGSFGSIAESVVAGAGAGAKAGEGATNQTSAFVQGAAAGLQIPAQLYAAKKAELQSTIDASPLSATMPDLAAKYKYLASMPTALAVHTIQQIAIDTQKLTQEHNNRMEEVGIQYVSKDEAPSKATLLSQSDLNGHTWTAGEVEGMPKDTLAQWLQKNAQEGAGYFGKGRRLTEPEMRGIARMVNNNDVATFDAMSTFQKAQFTEFYGTKYPGDSLINRVASAKTIQSPAIQRQLRISQSIVGDEKGMGMDGQPALSLQLLEMHKALGNWSTKGVSYVPGTSAIPAAANWLKTAWHGMTRQEALNSYNNLANSYANDVATALTGGVPTYERQKMERATLDAELPHEALKQAVDNTTTVLRQRISEIANAPAPGSNQADRAAWYAAGKTALGANATDAQIYDWMKVNGVK